jgi:hypothetical protein
MVEGDGAETHPDTIVVALYGAEEGAVAVDEIAVAAIPVGVVAADEAVAVDVAAAEDGTNRLATATTHQRNSNPLDQKHGLKYTNSEKPVTPVATLEPQTPTSLQQSLL